MDVLAKSFFLSLRGDCHAPYNGYFELGQRETPHQALLGRRVPLHNVSPNSLFTNQISLFFLQNLSDRLWVHHAVEMRYRFTYRLNLWLSLKLMTFRLPTLFVTHSRLAPAQGIQLPITEIHCGAFWRLRTGFNPSYWNPKLSRPACLLSQLQEKQPAKCQPLQIATGYRSHHQTLCRRCRGLHLVNGLPRK